MSDELIKWDWEKYILPIYKGLKFSGGTLHHRITNKNRNKNYIDDIYIAFYAEPLKFIDPVEGETDSEKPEMWFEQLYFEGKFSVDKLKDLENASYAFEPGEVLGSFTESIDFMVLNLDFGELNNGQIDLKMNFAFTNRDDLFEGDFNKHAEKSFSAETTLQIDNLVYLDYQKSYKTIDKLSKYLDSSVYALDNIEEFDFGIKDKGMKSYKVLIKK